MQMLYSDQNVFWGGKKHEEGGSLTIIATALIETGSRMDGVILRNLKVRAIAN